jgi:hypothetical protein
MKKLFLPCFLFLLAVNLNPLNDAKFILSLVDKKNATLGDAVNSFCYLNNINPTDDFNGNIDKLKDIIPHMPWKKTSDKKLTYGDFSLLAIQQIKIKSGIFYLSTNSGRYAIRELMLLNLIPYNTSEFKEMSGPELIKYLEKVAEYGKK